MLAARLSPRGKIAEMTAPRAASRRQAKGLDGAGSWQAGSDPPHGKVKIVGTNHFIIIVLGE